MDKKILLGGAAALLLVGNMYATPANAAIDLSIGGEAQVTLGMTDACGATAATAATGHAVLGVADDAALATKTGRTITDATDDGADSAEDLAKASSATFTDYSCAGDDDNPSWGFSKELSIGASGTLANGLEVSFSDTLDLTDTNGEVDSFELVLGGAFGELTMGSIDSAVDASSVGMPGELDHDLATDGTAGFGLLYSLPTMGALDVMISYAPNAEANNGGALDDAEYMDTFGIGAAFNAGVATISFGFESASSNDASCSVAGTATAEQVNTAKTAASLITSIYNDSVCGDMTVMAIGGEMEASGLTLSAGYSEVDSDGADRNTTSFGVATSVGDYSVEAGYAMQNLDFEVGGEGDETTAINLKAETALGDGVDLSLEFIQTETDLFSQKEGAGANTVYTAEVALTVGF
jgi:hypothetical protein